MTRNVLVDFFFTCAAGALGGLLVSLVCLATADAVAKFLIALATFGGP